MKVHKLHLPISSLAEETEPLGPNSLCALCPQHVKAPHVCVAPNTVGSKPHKPLIVLDYPDGGYGSSQMGGLNKVTELFLTSVLEEAGSTAWTISSALRCRPHDTGSVEPEHVEACRPYLADLMSSVPERILCMGPLAAQSLLGRKYNALSTRRGYAWLKLGKHKIPVFFLISPYTALTNSVVRSAFKRDVKNAITSNPIFMDGYSYVEVDGLPAALAAHGQLSKAQTVYFDVETHGKMYTPHFRIECITLWGESNGVEDSIGYLWDREALEDPELAAPLKSILEDASIAKGGHNIKYDVLSIRNEPLLGTLNGDLVDSRLIRKLVEADADGSLASCADAVGLGGHKEEAKTHLDEVRHHLSKLALSRHPTPAGKPRKVPVSPLVPRHEVGDYVLDALDAGAEEASFAYRWIPRPILHRYNALDVLATVKVTQAYLPRLRDVDEGPERVWREVTGPALKALVEMEHNGIPVDIGALRAFQQYLQGKLALAADDCRVTFGDDFNPASPQQVGKAMSMVGADLLVKKRTATGQIPTDDDTLSGLAEKYPNFKKILEFRRFNKLLGTYATSLLADVRSDGRIHANFMLDGAASGRVSCSSPNLQTWPRANNKDEPEGKMLRDCLCAPEGYNLVELDFGQLEIRGAAHLSKDPKMVEFFASGIDFHLQTAKLIAIEAFGKNPNDVDDNDRSQAKIAGFGLLYELKEKAPFFLARKLGISKVKAEKIITTIFGKFKHLSEWMDAQIALSRATGMVRTEWNGLPGRVRPLWDIGSTRESESYLRESAERSSYNSAVQGTCADLMTASLWKVHKFVQALGGELILTIHDSVLVTVPEDFTEDAVEGITQILCRYKLGDVPLTADAKVGKRWGSLEKWKS